MLRSWWSLVLVGIVIAGMVGCTPPSKEDEARAALGLPPAVEGAGLQWTEVFGSKPGDPSTAYCLMGSGFFGVGERTIHDDTYKAMQEWFHQHPSAEVVEVASFGPVRDEDPDSKMVYVWIKDGDEILNLDLVRHGYIGAHGLQTPLKDEILRVPVDEYRAVVDAGVQAETLAKQEKLGLWKESND